MEQTIDWFPMDLKGSGQVLHTADIERNVYWLQ